jgi:hypothetical protein
MVAAGGADGSVAVWDAYPGTGRNLGTGGTSGTGGYPGTGVNPGMDIGHRLLFCHQLRPAERPIVHLEWLHLPPLHPQLSDQEGIWSKHHQGRLVLLSAALDGSVHCVDYSGTYV